MFINYFGVFSKYKISTFISSRSFITFFSLSYKNNDTSLKNLFFFFKLHPLCLNPALLLEHTPKCVPSLSLVYTGKHIQEWLLLESLPSHFFATLKWTFLNSFSHSFICWSILGLEFKFCFKTLTIPFSLQKKLNASNIWLGQELCSHPNFTVFPTQTATQDTRSQHYCFLLTAWLIAWQRNQPKISSCMLNMKIFFFF